MQPTLYGIHYIDGGRSTIRCWASWPGPLDWLLFSTRRAEATIKTPGELDVNSFRAAGSMLADSTSFTIGGQSTSSPGDERKVIEYADLEAGRSYRPGEKLADGYLSMGDHLFVERWSIYLTPLRRGDVMVFTTEGLEADGRKHADLSGFFYIKRLVGLPGDTLKIVGNVLMIKPAGEEKFRPVYEIEPAFEKLYSGKGGYQGHLGGMGSLIASPQQEYVVPKDHYFMMGDNSQFSLDSRFFGAVPRRNLVGRRGSPSGRSRGAGGWSTGPGRLTCRPDGRKREPSRSCTGSNRQEKRNDRVSGPGGLGEGPLEVHTGTGSFRGRGRRRRVSRLHGRTGKRCSKRKIRSNSTLSPG